MPDVPVVIDPDCEHRGVVRFACDYYGNAHPRQIVLREYDERVLLHETLHVLLSTEPAGALPPGTDEHEQAVRHITRGLWDAGWRPTPLDSRALDEK